MKAKWGKYKAKDVDDLLAKLQSDHARQSTEWDQNLHALQQENQKLKERLQEMEHKEKLIAKVMVDATIRAKDIEEEYKRRAEESDAAYGRLNKEWVGNLQGCKVGIDRLRREAAGILLQIDEQFEALTRWSDSRLTQLEEQQLPQIAAAAPQTAPPAEKKMAPVPEFINEPEAPPQETEVQMSAPVPEAAQAPEETATPAAQMQPELGETTAAQPLWSAAEAIAEEIPEPTAEEVQTEEVQPETVAEVQPEQPAYQEQAPAEEAAPYEPAPWQQSPEPAMAAAEKYPAIQPQSAEEQSFSQPETDTLPAEADQPAEEELTEEEKELRRAVCMDLEKEIALGLNADLKALCQELGLFDDAPEE